MKLFYQENDQTKVYVQLNDLSLLERTEENVPAWIMNILWDHSPITDINKNQFVEFTSSEAIAYFRELSWIIDYNVIKNISDKEVEKHYLEIKKQLQTLDTMLQNIDPANNISENDLLNKYMQLKSKAQSLSDVLAIRRGGRKPNFPLVPYEEGFVFNLTNGPYIINECALDNTLLLSRKDGLELSVNDDIPPGFIANAVTTFIATRLPNPPFMGNIYQKIRVSDDNKYLIIEFRILELFEEPPIYPAQKPTIRERIRNIFTKRKKD